MSNRMMEAIEAGMVKHGVIEEGRDEEDLTRLSRDMTNTVNMLDPKDSVWLDEPGRVASAGELARQLSVWLHTWRRAEVAKGISDQIDLSREAKSLAQLAGKLKRASKKVVVPEDDD